MDWNCSETKVQYVAKLGVVVDEESDITRERTPQISKVQLAHDAQEPGIVTVWRMLGN